MYASAFALRLVYGTFYLAIFTGLPDFLRDHQPCWVYADVCPLMGVVAFPRWSVGTRRTF